MAFPKISPIKYFYFFKGISAFINLLIVILAAKVLAIEDFSVYSFLMSSAGVLAAISTLGIPQLAVRKINYLVIENDKEEISHWISNSLFIQSVMTCICIILYSIILYFKGISILNIGLFAVFCLCSTAIVFFSEVLRGFQKTLEAVIYLELLKNLLVILPVLLFYFALINLSLFDILLITSASSLIIVYICLLKIIPYNYYKYFFSYLKELKKIFVNSRSRIILLESTPFLALAVLAYVQVNDSFLLGYFVENKDLALIILAFKICSILVVIFNSTTLWFSTYIAQYLATKETDKLIRVTHKIAYIQIIASLGFSFFLYFAFPYLIRYVGLQYKNTGDLIIIYSIGFVLTSFFSSPATILAYANQEKIVMKLLIINFLLYIVISYFIYPYFGLISIPLVYSIVNFLYNIALSLSVKKYFNFIPILFLSKSNLSK